MTATSPTRRTALAAILAAAALRPAFVLAQPAPDHRAAALRIARDFIVPRTDAFARASSEQAKAWDAFAAAPSQSGVAALDRAFGAAADAWAGIELVRFGPVAEELRYERMAHWPERRGAVARALSGVLAGTEEITPERVRRASVAGQGLTATERLLWGEAEGGAAQARRDLLDRSPAGARRRALGRAVAQLLARAASETAAAWTAPDGALARLERAGPDDAREAVTRFVTDEVAALDAIADGKVGAVLGKGTEEARPGLAEGWRSGRSLRTIRLNIEAAIAFSRAALADDAEALRTVLPALDTPLSVASDLEKSGRPLGALAADGKTRPQVILLRDALLSARTVSGPALSEALAVTVGFNSADGD